MNSRRPTNTRGQLSTSDVSGLKTCGPDPEIIWVETIFSHSTQEFFRPASAVSDPPLGPDRLQPPTLATMFGDGSSAATSKASTLSFPQLPVFLLPSFKLPFRRRRTPSDRTASTSSTASTAPTTPGSTTTAVPPSYESSLFGLPSLSSSPTSSLSTSPASPTSYFSTFPATNPFVKTRGLSRDEPRPMAARASFTSTASSAAILTSQPPQPHLARTAPDTLRCSTCSADLAFGAQIVSKGFTGRHGRAYLVSATSPSATPSCPGTCAPRTGEANAALASRADDPRRGNLINVRVGRPESRQLVTGAHVVADICCAVCSAKLGWKYVDAKEAAQKYKVGKFILETQRVVGFRSWEDVGGGDEFDEGLAGGGGAGVLHGHGAEVSGQGRRPPSPMGTLKEPRTSEEDGSAGSGHPDDISDEERREEEAGEIMFDSDDEDECEDIFAGVWDAEVVAKRRKGKIANLRRKHSSV